jgi:hypothetical protein
MGPAFSLEGDFMFARGSTLARSRWAGIGAAVAVSLGAGGIGLIAHAAGGSAPSSFVSIAPCRLFDTRPAPLTVGNRNTPLTGGEEFVRQVTGTNGNCVIPADATGISYNLTVPTSVNGYLTVYPADATRPLASSINPVGGEGVKANGGIVGLSATGAIKLYTLTGPVDALLDVTGYFLPAGNAAGPTAYVSHLSGGVDTTELQSVLTSVSVPAGSYVVSAKLYGLASGLTMGSHSILCSLKSGLDQFDYTHLTSNEAEYRNLSLAGSVTLATAGTLDLTCSATAPDSSTVAAYTLYGITLTAITVGALDDQSPVI